MKRQSKRVIAIACSGLLLFGAGIYLYKMVDDRNKSDTIADKVLDDIIMEGTQETVVIEGNTNAEKESNKADEKPKDVTPPKEAQVEKDDTKPDKEPEETSEDTSKATSQKTTETTKTTTDKVTEKPKDTKVAKEKNDKSNAETAPASPEDTTPVEVVVSEPTEPVAEEPTVKENKDDELVFVIDSIGEDVKNRITNVSWKPECPVSLDKLAYVTVSYLDFNNEIKQGELIVHKKVANEIVDIFKEIYKSGFQIEKITLVDNYSADDTKSMEDNNTSAFNYRPVAGTTKLSKHSYGIAIDINPIQNPYVKGDYYSPKASKEYLDRSNVRKGMIVKNDVVYKAFKSRGWIWGGEWNTMKDYQHFQKTINLDLLVD